MTVYASYQDYLASQDWKQRRARILKRDNYQCKICGTGMNLRVHHIRYPDILGEEPDEDLITVCDSCHEKIHSNDVRQKRATAERIRTIQENTRKWAEEAKTEDFLFGGKENMCSLNLLKEKKREYEEKHRCQISGVSCLQAPLGYAHWLLVKEMFKNGFSSFDIYVRTPLNKDTINRYLSGSREEYMTEEKWDYDVPTLKEIHYQVHKYVEAELEQGRKG